LIYGNYFVGKLVSWRNLANAPTYLKQIGRSRFHKYKVRHNKMEREREREREREQRQGEKERERERRTGTKKYRKTDT
jgi:hypothetical protein